MADHSVNAEMDIMRAARDALREVAAFQAGPDLAQARVAVAITNRSNPPDEWSANILPLVDDVVDRDVDNEAGGAFDGFDGFSTGIVRETNVFDFQVEVIRKGQAILEGMEIAAEIIRQFAVVNWKPLCDSLERQHTAWATDNEDTRESLTLYAMRFSAVWTSTQGDMRFATN